MLQSLFHYKNKIASCLVTITFFYRNLNAPPIRTKNRLIQNCSCKTSRAHAESVQVLSKQTTQERPNRIVAPAYVPQRTSRYAGRDRNGWA
jgi:hypothetical protein